jgi:hopanoid biosynthesis associated radical SAM protein HpnH
MKAYLNRRNADHHRCALDTERHGLILVPKIAPAGAKGGSGMSVPVSQMWAVASYVIRQKLAGRKRYPLVLMLEPLYRCNLACAGCGKIQYPGHVLKQEMPVEQALAAADECGAPMVSIPGGEPLMHSQIEKIVEGLVARKKYIYLCTNALLLKEKLDAGLFKPSKFLTFSVHMDGDEDAHDFAVCREGTYKRAEDAIRTAVRMGFRVTTNTTLFQHADVERTRAFFDRMMALGVEGMTISPGYSYQKAPDQESFLSRSRTYELFKGFLKKAKKHWRFNQSPLFLEFLMGKRHFECTPWGNPAYSMFGWQKPCYLMQEGYAKSFKELIEKTPWENYGRASGNPKCQQCMVHCGYEPSAVDHTFGSLEGFLATVRATMFGVNSERGKTVTPPPVRRHVETGIEGAKGKDPVTLALLDAVDFRGDVTITLEDGTRVTGYLFNATNTEVEYMPSDGTGAVVVPRHKVMKVEKTGRDMADGKSWEAWVKKWNENKARVARGEKALDISLHAEALT